MPSLEESAQFRPLALNGCKSGYWDGDANVWRDGPFWYDEVTADKAVAFFTDHLVLSEGQWAGNPFLLEPWQEHDIIRPLFGWKRANGTRRFRRAFVWVARKNGKTELAAGVALLVLLGDGEPAGQVFSIAAEKEQASIVFTKAANMVARSSTLGGLVESYRDSLYCPRLNASFRPLSGKPQGKHGLSMSGLVGDEIHEWRNGDLYTFIHDSAAARRQPLEFLISTAGVRGTHGEEVFNESLSRLAGDIDDPETLDVIYAADRDDDWTLPDTWKKANPNLGVSLKLEDMASACRQAQQLPRLENDFRRYKLNQWTDQAVRWLPIDGVDDEGRRFGWDHCAGPLDWRELEKALLGKRCFGGLDLASTQDLSALTWWFPVQEGLATPAVLTRFFKPEALLKAHAVRDKLPYERWAKEGALLTTPGNVTDYAFIEEQVYRDAVSFQIAHYGETSLAAGDGGLAIDRFNATSTAVRLAQEGIPVVLFGQGFVSLSAPAKELERLVMANGFHHGGQPILRRHAQAVAIETDAAGNIKPSKANSTQRIDGIASLVNALGIAARDKGEDVFDLDSFLSDLASN
jgi:phage terminase large subunit-like protein